MPGPLATDDARTSSTLALFDLDHTLLDGDSDDLWCRFLVRYGLVDPSLDAINERLGEDYRNGLVGVQEFSDFDTALLAARAPAFWAPWQSRFLEEEILHRLPATARACVDRHRKAGHVLVMTTASNRLIAARTAEALGFEHLLATEPEVADGLLTGRVMGEPNMRAGKVHRLQAWLADRGLSEQALASAWFYSDSINDLPLLSAAGRSVAVNPDPMLAQHARAQGWPIEDLLGRQRAPGYLGSIREGGAT